jgi:hypothetical protein
MQSYSYLSECGIGCGEREGSKERRNRSLENDQELELSGPIQRLKVRKGDQFTGN